MLIFLDGANYDDILALIFFLKSGIKIDTIVITANGWGHAGPSYSIITNIVAWFGRNIPVIVGSLYSLFDYKCNWEVKGFIQGKTFGRSIPEQFLAEIDILYSLSKYIPQYDNGVFKYDENFMEKIKDIVDGLNEVYIFSMGGMTDVAKTLKYMKNTNQIYKLRSLYQLGGYHPDEEDNSLEVIDRSFNAEFNVYLDPHAAQISSDIAGKKMHWILASTVQEVQMNIKDLYDVAIRSKSYSSEFVYLLSQMRLEGTNNPDEQEEGLLIMWDAIAAIVYIYKDLIKEENMIKVKINNDVDMCISKDYHCCDSNTIYKYNFGYNLGEIENDCHGQCNNFITSIDIEKTRLMFLNLLGSHKNDALCQLMRPIGCYEYENIELIPPSNN